MKRFVTLTASAVLGAGESPDVAFVPPMVRRRLSLLQKIYFSLANSVCSRPPAGAVFASRDGEDGLTRRIVDSFNGDGTVSPYQFSASVYNAAPGLWSVHTKNRSPYTAVAAGDDTVECGLLETFGAPAPALFVYAEETGGGYGQSVPHCPGTGPEPHRCRSFPHGKSRYAPGGSAASGEIPRGGSDFF